MRFNFLCIILLFLFSCGQDLSSMGKGNSGRGSSNSSINALTCSCSDANQPVCAIDGSTMLTVRNGCIAQCNGLSYRSGACEDNQTSCDSSRADICGQPPCTGTACPSPGIYESQCALMNAGATQVNMSECISL